MNTLDPVVKSSPELPAEGKMINEVVTGGSFALICNAQGSPAPSYR